MSQELTDRRRVAWRLAREAEESLRNYALAAENAGRLDDDAAEAGDAADRLLEFEHRFGRERT